MPLPVGAGNSANSIPFALQNNAARPSERAMQKPKVETLTGSDINGRDFVRFIAADAWSKPGGSCAEISRISGAKIGGGSSMIDALKLAMFEGNPERKTLRDLSLILKLLVREAVHDECGDLQLVGEAGQVILRPRSFWRGVTIHTHAVGSYNEFRKEKHAKFTDALTLSVLRTLFRQSTVDNFTSGRCAVIDAP